MLDVWKPDLLDDREKIHFFLGNEREGKIYPFAEKDIFGFVAMKLYATFEGAKNYKQLLSTQFGSNEIAPQLNVYRINLTSTDIEKVD
jgi:hypothetical protein